MTGIEAREMIEHMSADDARNLMWYLQLHIAGKEASMTPAELHEHLKEVPDQLFQEAEELSWRFQSEMRDLVAGYIVRHGDWERDEYSDEYTDEDWGGFDPERVHDEFASEISRLTDELMAELFAPAEADV